LDTVLGSEMDTVGTLAGSGEGIHMTTAVKAPDVDVLSQDDVAAVVNHALVSLGVSFAELAEQARSGHFSSIEARLAWLAIGDAYQR
jgi:hypothetical protein